MQIALCNKVLRELPFEEQCAQAKRIGYDALEIAPFTLGDEPHRLDASVIETTRATVASAGLKVSGLHMLLQRPTGLSITTDDHAIAATTRDVGERLVALCAELGGRYLVHGSAAQRHLSPAHEDTGRKRAFAYFEAMAKAAESAKVVYCIEPLAPDLTNYVSSVAEAVEIVDRIASPALKTMIDCCHAARSEKSGIPALLWQYVSSGHIAHIHANDPNRRGPGQGTLDFAGIVQAIRDTGYQGAIGVEPFIYEPDGLTCAAQSLRYLRSFGA
jgi:sugar phosphate isomerase/epimerase